LAVLAFAVVRALVAVLFFAEVFAAPVDLLAGFDALLALDVFFVPVLTVTELVSRAKAFARVAFLAAGFLAAGLRAGAAFLAVVFAAGLRAAVVVAFFAVALAPVVAFFAAGLRAAEVVAFFAAPLAFATVFFAVALPAAVFDVVAALAAGLRVVVEPLADDFAAVAFVVVFFTGAFFAVVVALAAGLRAAVVFPAAVELPDVFVAPAPLLAAVAPEPFPLMRIVWGLAVASGDPSEVLPVVGSFFALPPGRLVMRACSPCLLCDGAYRPAV
jgi:hypothetical protein